MQFVGCDPQTCGGEGGGRPWTPSRSPSFIFAESNVSFVLLHRLIFIRPIFFPFFIVLLACLP